MPTAELVSIGTELLLGEIVDTNAAFIARALRDIGVDLFRKTVIGDNAQRIAGVLCEALERSEIIITTGGLGPTVDDPTRDAVALAVGRDLEFREDLWDQIKERFRSYGREPTDNNRQQAYIPSGAIPIKNPVGTAPCFIAPYHNDQGDHFIFSLPGVPREMEQLLMTDVIPYLVEQYNLHGVILARVLHTAGTGESQIDSVIGDLERLSNPTVGLAAHSGQVDVRITAKASSREEAEALIRPVEADLRNRLGKWIYGVDDETLEQMAVDAVSAKGWSLAAVEAGTGGELLTRLYQTNGEFKGGSMIPPLRDSAELESVVHETRASRRSDVCLGVSIIRGETKFEVSALLITPEGTFPYTRSYGGPPGYAPRYAVHTALDVLRRLGKS